MPLQAFDQIADRLTASLLAGDFLAYTALMQLPLQITPRDGEAYVLRTEDDLLQDFQLYHGVVQAQGVTDIYREVLGKTSAADKRVVIHCMTHILARAHRIFDPFETAFHLVHDVAGWRIARIESSEGHIKWTLGQGVGDDAGQIFTEGDK